MTPEKIAVLLSLRDELEMLYEQEHQAIDQQRADAITALVLKSQPSALPDERTREENDHGAGLIHPVASPLAETLPRPSNDPIVGHKTFHDGHHEPLRQSEAEAIMAASDRANARRAEQMPDEQSAIDAIFDAWLRLRDFGWREAQYCPKDGQVFDAIEAGSTGIHDRSPAPGSAGTRGRDEE